MVTAQFQADRPISCQFVHVQAPAAYGPSMLSCELVSWPGLPNPGTDGGSLGLEEQLCCSIFGPLCPLSLALAFCLEASFPTAPPHMSAPLYVQVDGDLILFQSKQLNGKKKTQETKHVYYDSFIITCGCRDSADSPVFTED